MGKATRKRAAQATNQPFLHLYPKNGNGTVTIETEDEDRFYLTVEAAIQACKAFGKLADSANNSNDCCKN